MKNTYRLLILMLTMPLLFAACSSGREPVTESSRAEWERIRTDHDHLTDHLVSASVQAELLASTQRPDVGTPVLRQEAGDLDQELDTALSLAAELETELLPGDKEIMVPAGRLTVVQLKKAKSRVGDIWTSLTNDHVDADALRRAAGETRAAIDAAATQHDALLPAISDPELEFRMFALAWPHSELALHHAALLKALDRLEDDTSPNWATRWSEQLETLESHLTDSLSAFRSFADRIELLPNSKSTYSPERGDDAFNDLTASIRRAHDSASHELEGLDAELRKPGPDMTAALRRVQSMRQAIEAARKAHRDLMDSLDEPYPDFDDVPW